MDVGDDEYTCGPHDFLSQIGEGGGYNVIEPLVDEQSNDKGSDGKSLVEKPYLNQEFDNLDDVYNFYNCYALHKGFGIRRSSSSKSSVTRELIWKKFVCDKAGWRAKNKEKEDGSEVVSRCRETRDGCMASLNVRWKKHGKWVVTGFVEEHSHTLDTPRRTKKHRSHNVSHKISAAKDLMEQLHNCGMGPSIIAKAINTTSNITEITTKHMVNHLRKHKMNNVGREGYLVAMHFMKQMRLDPNFYFATEYDSDGTLRSMFWADARSREEYFVFGDVIVFDVTYKTNKFMMPFAPFTGVNHHIQSILFGCALLADETEETFVWLFQHWLSCMLDKAPGAIITDMDGAMRNAIRRVFPNTRHRFCSWHIHKHLVENVNAMRDNNGEFSSDYRKWFHSRNVSKSEIRWQALVEKYGIQADSWLAKMWDLRLHWVPAFLKDIFVAGMTSSGRSESINSFFDGFVNSNTHLGEFIEQYNRALMSRRQAEERKDCWTMNSNPKLITRFAFEKTIADCYTTIMFKLFQAELHESGSCWHEMVSNHDAATTYIVGLCDEEKRKWWTVVYDEAQGVTLKCECAKFESEGYHCKHILRIMQERHLTVIPEQYMLKRWTIGARYIMDSGVSTSKENKNTVTPIMEWCITALAAKAAHKASSSIATYNEFRSWLNGFMGKFDELCLTDSQFVPPDGIRSEVGSTIIPFGQTNSQKEKKKGTCSICLEKGHYMTTCPKKAKMHMSDEEDDVSNESGEKEGMSSQHY